MEEKANVEIKKTIDRLEFLIDEDCSDTQFDYIEEIESAIKALTELQQYHAIGTPEECRTAREKQMPKKPIRHTAWEDFKCPACGSTEIRPYDTEYSEYDKDCKFEYCSDCGQKLDWGDDDEID